MRKYVVIDKAIGVTPLTAIQQWKEAHPRYADLPASYAGRLDPMASGKLLVLLGKECRHQKRYMNLDKIYDIEVLLDIGSDTGDVLGIVSPNKHFTQISRKQITKWTQSERGTHLRRYPTYSSKPVDGKPLFLHALEGTLQNIDIPLHHETVHHITYRGRYSLSTPALQARISSLLNQAPVSDEPSKKLGADFRISDVRKSWNQVWNANRTYQVVRLRISCGSGTYMRSLASRFGEALGTNALALSIRRIHIGKRRALGPVVLWQRV